MNEKRISISRIMRKPLMSWTADGESNEMAEKVAVMIREKI